MIVLALALLRARSVRARAYLGVKVLAEGHRRPDYTAQVEDGPEDADELPLLILGGVRQHQRTLSRPEQAGADAQNGSCTNDKAAGVGMDIDGAGRTMKLAARCDGEGCTHRYDPM